MVTELKPTYEELEKKIKGLEQRIGSLEDGHVELAGEISDSNISRNTLERKVDGFINRVSPLFQKLGIL